MTNQLFSIDTVELILFVSNQENSTKFYASLFNLEPCLYVTGMTEFQINSHIKLGLMPNDGIARLLQANVEHPDKAQGIPKCEFYLHVSDIHKAYTHALAIGAKELSPILERSWGDVACYFQDPDGHIIAFAERQ